MKLNVIHEGRITFSFAKMFELDESLFYWQIYDEYKIRICRFVQIIILILTR